NAVAYYNVQPVSGNPVISWGYCTTGLSPNLLVCGDEQSTDIYVWDLTNRAGSVLVRKITSGTSAYASGAGWYGVWHAPSNAFLFYDQSKVGGGSAIVKLAMSDPAHPLTSSWVWSNVPANAANTVT